MGGLARCVYIGCRLRLPLERWARLNSSTDGSLVVNRLCDLIDAGNVPVLTAFILSMNSPRRGYLEHY